MSWTRNAISPTRCRSSQKEKLSHRWKLEQVCRSACFLNWNKILLRMNQEALIWATFQVEHLLFQKIKSLKEPGTTCSWMSLREPEKAWDSLRLWRRDFFVIWCMRYLPLKLTGRPIIKYVGFILKLKANIRNTSIKRLYERRRREEPGSIPLEVRWKCNQTRWKGTHNEGYSHTMIGQHANNTLPKESKRFYVSSLCRSHDNLNPVMRWVWRNSFWSQLKTNTHLHAPIDTEVLSGSTAGDFCMRRTKYEG